jgi:hypothetical protein
VTEADRLWIATVFAADTDLQVLLRAATFFDRNLHQLANAFAIDRHEGVSMHDAVFEVVPQELAGIVAAEAHRRLRQVVRAETEEVRGPRDVVGCHRRARHFDHGANRERDADVVFLHYQRRGQLDALTLVSQFR